MLRRERWQLALAIALYWIAGALLIAQRPGLQDDEALLVAGAVHMRHSGGEFELLQTPGSWVCPFGQCIPLMSASYVGAVKEYAVLPFFECFGPRVPFIRLVSLLLSTLGLWGIYRLVAGFWSSGAAAVATIVVALNPVFVDMTVFDNNAVGAMMAGLGLTCGCLAIYRARKSYGAAFALGLAMGFALWARANFLWVLIAGFGAAVVVFRRRLAIPLAHWMALVLGGVLGSLPFLIFQIISGGGTWKVMQNLAVTPSLATLLRDRIFWFAETLISDGEHRQMWAGPSAPPWQLWLFAGAVVVACGVCLFGVRRIEPGRRAFARALSITFLATAASLFFSRLPVAEHHLIILLPMAAAMVVLACATLQAAFPRARVIGAGMLAIYLGCALYWQGAAVRGLRETGGLGRWSDADLPLARYLDQNVWGHNVKFLDWGLQYNLYVLTDGRVKSSEIYSAPWEDRSAQGRPWVDEIRDGGVFVLNGPEDRAFPKPSAGFLHALAINRPEAVAYRVRQRNGEVYAEVLRITPNSMRGPAAPGQTVVDRLEMGDRQFDDRLTGFYPPEEGRFRWTRRQFSARLSVAGMDVTGAQLLVRLYIPDSVMEKLGPITLRGSVDGHALRPETWRQAGQYVYRRELDPDWIAQGSAQVDFALDKALPPTSQDQRERGIVVNEVSIGTL